MHIALYVYTPLHVHVEHRINNKKSAFEDLIGTKLLLPSPHPPVSFIFLCFPCHKFPFIIAAHIQVKRILVQDRLEWRIRRKWSGNITVWLLVYEPTHIKPHTHTTLASLIMKWNCDWVNNQSTYVVYNVRCEVKKKNNHIQRMHRDSLQLQNMWNMNVNTSDLFSPCAVYEPIIRTKSIRFMCYLGTLIYFLRHIFIFDGNWLFCSLAWVIRGYCVIWLGSLVYVPKKKWRLRIVILLDFSHRYRRHWIIFEANIRNMKILWENASIFLINGFFHLHPCHLITYTTYRISFNKYMNNEAQPNIIIYVSMESARSIHQNRFVELLSIFVFHSIRGKAKRTKNSNT